MGACMSGTQVTRAGSEKQLTWAGQQSQATDFGCGFTRHEAVEVHSGVSIINPIEMSNVTHAMDAENLGVAQDDLPLEIEDGAPRSQRRAHAIHLQ